MANPEFEIDQDIARRLLVEGATLIFLDVPTGTEFGIDMKSWNTGERFKGIKMIPPGIHYVFYSSVDEYGDCAPRIGFMHDFKKSEFIVKKWDSQNEEISSEEIPEEEYERYKGNLHNLDQFLGPYPFDIYSKWKSLSSAITVDLIKKLSPESGCIRAALELVICEKKPSGSPASKRRRSRVSTAEEKEEAFLPNLQPVPGTELRLTPMPDKGYPDGSTPAEITKHSMDSSYMLESMLATYDNPQELVGELQFCFVSFLIGHSLEAFEHWKKIVGLLCSCDAAIPKYTDVYLQFIASLDSELFEIPADFLVDIVASNNFIYVKLRELFRTLKDHEALDGRLKTKAGRFRDHLTQKFHWDFTYLDEEDEDEAPVVVSLD